MQKQRQQRGLICDGRLHSVQFLQFLNVVMAYLFRAEGASLHASIGTMSGCLLNIVLDPIFILPWGLDMGAEGAGLATFISNCVACLYFFVLMYKKTRKDTCLHPSVTVWIPESNRIWCMRSRNSCCDTESLKCNRNDDSK